jgi:serine/threonine protein kinase
LQSVASIEDISNFIPKISDMGLSKHLDSKDGFSYSSMNFAQSTGAKGSQSSTIDSAVNPVGTVGWQAPEILHLQRKLMSRADGSSCGSSSPNPVASGSSSMSRLQTVDIFSLGCVYHYVLFPGDHPFGEWFEREANIMNGHLDLQHLKQVPDLLDLLSRMLANDPMHRPSAAEVSAHPFFWSSAKRLDFLVFVSDRLEREPSNSPIMITLESNAAAIVGRHWDRKLHPSFLEDLGKYRKYDTSSVRDCLRVIRNKKHHFLELSEELKLMMSPVPSGFLMYFEQRFPRLLLHIVSTAVIHLASEREFQDLLGSAIHLFVGQNMDELSSFRGASLQKGDLPAASSISINDGITIERIKHSDKIAVRHEDSSDITIWSGSRLCDAHGVRGWWESGSLWDTSFTTMHCKARARPGHLLKSITDWKYRSRLCTHWELTGGTTCPMRRKGKCDFAHGMSIVYITYCRLLYNL